MPQRDDQAARSSCPEPAPRLDLPAKSSLPPSDTLSALIERALREEAAVGEPSFTARWRGRFRAANRDDTRYDALARKYL